MALYGELALEEAVDLSNNRLQRFVLLFSTVILRSAFISLAC
jgi:hypothetical protein